MDQSVVIQMSAQDAELVAAWQRTRKGPQDMEKELEKLGRRGKQTGKDLQDAFSSQVFDQFAQSVLGVTPGLALLTTFADKLKAKWDAIIQKQQEALGQAVGLETSQRRAIDALADNADITPSELIQLSTTSNIPAKEQLSAFRSGLKEAGSDFSNRRAAETATAVAVLTPAMDAAERDSIVGGAVTLQKQNNKLTPQQAAAAVLSISRKSESTAGEVSESLIPAVGRMQNIAGGDIGQFVALTSAIEGKMDQGTAPAASVAEKFVKEMATQGEKAGAFKRGASLDQMLAATRKNKKLKAAVMQKFAKLKEAFVPLRELLESGTSDTSASLTGLTDKFRGSPDETLAAEQARLTAVGGQPSVALATQSRAVDKSKEQRLADSGLTLRGLADKAKAEASDLAGWADATPQSVMRDVMHSALLPLASDEGYANTQSRSIRDIAVGVGDKDLRAKIEKLAENIEAQTKALVEQNKITLEWYRKPTVKVESLPANSRPAAPASRDLND